MLRKHSLLAVLFAATACASAAKSSGPDAASPTAEAPQFMRGGTPPALLVPASVSSRATVRVEIEVMVDEAGRPDMNTFKATGLGADVNRDALRTWIENASFRPARLDGRSVPGLFKMRLEASARRM